ncbi:MAG: hypothetical protein HOV66_27635, partial [Streptomycetaceae bacterium]|nr:hypothetical protein [Streptomycetaceae bacterium]
YAGDLDRLVDFDASRRSTAVVHGQYADFLRAPLDTVRSMYEGLGMTLEPAAEERMRTYLAGRPKDKHGVHSYSFDDLGLDRAQADARFGRYRTHFAVPRATQ